MCVASSICCSINIDNVKYLPLPSSARGARACVSVLSSLFLLLDLTTITTDSQWGKKARKHSQVPDPSLNLTDKLSGIVEELHSSLTFLSSAGIFADEKCVLTPALKQEMFSETFFLSKGHRLVLFISIYMMQKALGKLFLN